ncbi:MAG: hypothetical protein ACRD8O_02165 [Bryobacteraceae bacterium]
MTDRTRVCLAGCASLVGYAWLACLSRQTERVPLVAFFAAMGVATAAMVWVYADGAEGLTALRLVIAFGIAFRLIGLWGHPLYEDDFYRYLWDGRVLASGENPYARPPSAWFGDDSIPEPFQRILDHINFPDIPTIYGPVCQVAFVLSYSIAPGELWPLKLIFFAADLGVLVLLWKLLDRKAAIVLYAWSPLVIKEVSFTAHTDILAVVFLVAALLGIKRGRVAMSGVPLGLAVGTRLHAALLAPFLIRGRKLGWLALIAVLAAVYAPFAASGGMESEAVAVFLREWEFNSLGYGLLRWLLGDRGRVVAGVLFAAAYAWLLRTRWREPESSLPRGDVLLGAFFLLAPVVNPWYLLPMLPFVVLRPTPWGIAAMPAVLLSYITERNLGVASGYQHAAWVRPVECAIVGLALLWRPRRVRGPES